jgi:hypothetical protein
MPEISVKEVRLPELHLPEIKRDEIVRALSGIRIPDVDLASAGRGKGLQDRALAALPWRRSAPSANDLGKLIAAGVAAARLARPAAPRSSWKAVRRSRSNLVALVRPAPRRSRRRFVLVAFILAIGGWIVLRDPSNRERLNRAANTARQRIDEMRADRRETLDGDSGEPVSVISGESAPVPDQEILAAEAPVVINS